MSSKTELPNSELAKQIHSSATELVVQIVRHFCEGKDPINEIIFVPLTIFARIIRTHLAIELLIEQKHPSEAAVLALTEFELRLALAHTASDIKQATEWVAREDRRFLSMKTKDQICALFDKKADQDRLYNVFQHLSGIKHGNPVYSELSFPVRAQGASFMISTGPIEDEFSKKLNEMIYAYSIYQLSWSSQVVNKLTGQYAVVDKQLRVKLDEWFHELEPVEGRFLDFINDVVSQKRTYLGIKALFKAKPPREH